MEPGVSGTGHELWEGFPGPQASGGHSTVTCGKHAWKGWKQGWGSLLSNDNLEAGLLQAVETAAPSLI